jgi:endonuclease YncB( thermonuclease family)
MTRAPNSPSKAERALLCLAFVFSFVSCPGPPTRPARAEAPTGFVEGRVIAVFDGDTLEARVDEENLRVRIAGIDTPERGQPWAERAKQALSARVFGKDVRINRVAVDRYGRTVGEVYADDVCVGCELVREGHAWVYRGFNEDPVLFELEAEARAAGRGLWGLPEADRTPPWEWRRARRAGRGERKAPDSAAPAFVCGAKRRCGEMTSCREARFHLETCAVESLDGDEDGVPCEGLCRDE